MNFCRCLSQGECKGITVEACDYPLPILSFRTMSSFDCEKDCKAHENCFFFKFSEGNGVCEFFESEYRTGCSEISATMVGYFHVYISWETQKVAISRIKIVYVVNHRV